MQSVGHVLTYIVSPCARSGQRKLLHMLLNAFAVVAAIFGVIAAFRSHTLKRPVPTPNLYSPHSYLGITTLVLLGMQVRPIPRPTACACVHACVLYSPFEIPV